ncbi:MAG: cell division protein FtsQ/DivIB [Candidatus Aadella gelida]|nr:cell division protein FtsQ/DivIB [Candidatus Aadella gelida]
MAKKRNKKKKRGSFSFVTIFENRNVILMITGIALIVMMGFLVRYFVYNSRGFDIRKVVINNVKGYIVDSDNRKIQKRYAGRNIFTVNLKQAEDLINNDFRTFRNVEVRRILPDVLEIDITAREPVAVIDAMGGIVVDIEGFVIDVGETPENLTKIKGITFFFRSPAKETFVKNKNLEKALLLMRGIDKILPEVKGNIDYIDVSDNRNTILSVKGVEIKMGSDGYLSKMKNLREIMPDPEMDIRDMNYIDLRFEDAVISPK